MRYLLSPGNTLLVQGPASIRLLSGDALVLGASLARDKRLVVRQEKQLPIESRSEVDMEIYVGELGKITEVAGCTIPRSWEEAVNTLADMREGKVMVIGATDVGKSTLCTYLTNGLLNRKLSIELIDADIGQADIGPPTSVGKAIPTGFLSSLIDLSPEALVFIGHTSPSRVERKLMEGIRLLVSHYSEKLTIINTDGWVNDPEAIVYKLGLIAAIKPDLVIGIPTGTELEPILSASAARSIRVEASHAVLTRSRTDRHELRNAGYRRFLEGGCARTLSLRNVHATMPDGLAPFQRWQSRDLENLIVGLIDGDGYLLQIGVLLRFEKGYLQIYSRPAEGVREIEIGYVRLSTDGIELGYLEI
jgi:polynucleotide 5'-hydroxyl-kinase GRC3/NOL9